jgi:hypothetical protein
MECVVEVSVPSKYKRLETLNTLVIVGVYSPIRG